MTKVATITLNSAYDLVGQLPQIELGEVNLVQTLGLFPAGKGINVAKVLKDLGVNVAVGGFLGQDNAAEFEHLFRLRGLEDRFQRVSGRTRINVKITENQGKVTDINFSGYVIQPNDWQTFVASSLCYCQPCEIVAVSGSLPQGISLQQFTDWLQQLTGLGIKVILDSSNAAFAAGIIARPWLVKPNLRELEAWAGKSLNQVSDILQAAKQLQAQGIENVVVSMGEQGALWLRPQQILQATLPQALNVVSTVGAGDSMVAGLIYAMTQSFSAEQSLAFATAVSALAVTQSNVGVPHRQLLDPLLQQVQIRTLEG